MSKDDEEVLLDYNEEDDAVQEPTKEKEVKASKWVYLSVRQRREHFY